jgi:hypothetical protein
VADRYGPSRTGQQGTQNRVAYCGQQFSYWGCPEHGYDTRAELEWGYGSIMGDRDTNTHCFNFMFTIISAAFAFSLPLRVTPTDLVTICCLSTATPSPIST